MRLTEVSRVLPNCICISESFLGRSIYGFPMERDSLLDNYLKLYTETGLLMQYDDRLDSLLPGYWVPEAMATDLVKCKSLILLNQPVGVWREDESN